MKELKVYFIQVIEYQSWIAFLSPGILDMQCGDTVLRDSLHFLYDLSCV